MTYARLVLIATNQEELETLFWRHNLKTRMKDWRAITMYWKDSVTSSINQLLIFCRKGLWLSSIILSGEYFLSTRWVNRIKFTYFACSCSTNEPSRLCSHFSVCLFLSLSLSGLSFSASLSLWPWKPGVPTLGPINHGVLLSGHLSC